MAAAPTGNALATPTVVLTLKDHVEKLGGIAQIREQLTALKGLLTDISLLATKGGSAMAKYQRSAGAVEHALQTGLPKKGKTPAAEIETLLGYRKGDFGEYLAATKQEIAAKRKAITAELRKATAEQAVIMKEQRAMLAKWAQDLEGLATTRSHKVATRLITEGIVLPGMSGKFMPSYQEQVLGRRVKEGPFGWLGGSGGAHTASLAFSKAQMDAFLAHLEKAAPKTATASGTIGLTVPAAQINAVLGPGPITLTIPASQVSGAPITQGANPTLVSPATATAAAAVSSTPVPPPQPQPPPTAAKGKSRAGGGRGGSGGGGGTGGGGGAGASGPAGKPFYYEYVWNSGKGGFDKVLSKERVSPKETLVRTFNPAGEETNTRQILNQDAEDRARRAAQKAGAQAEAQLRRETLSAEMARARTTGRLLTRWRSEAVRDKRDLAARLAQEASQQQAHGFIADRIAEGFSYTPSDPKVRSTRGGATVTSQSYRLTRRNGGLEEGYAIRLSRDELGALSTTIDPFNRKISAARGDRSAAGRGALSNLEHVGTWMTSVWALFGALRAVSYTLKSVTETGHQTARLQQVFTGIGGSAQALRNDILSLAAANGRSRDEAMESAIAWSRLGVTKQDVAKAVRVSLMAANVAEMDAAEATRHLMAIMAAYGLGVDDLGSKLGELNAISNTWNVTNNDLLQGISRVAAVAKQAGLPLEELMGIIGATVGYTGQTGANIGNALKSFTVAIGNPAIQKFLESQFQFTVKNPQTGDLQDMSTILRNLYVQYQDLTRVERQYLLVKTAGKTQASRVASMLDAYVQGQVLATNAQLNLGSAKQENALITATLRSQVAGLVTEYEKLAAVQMDRGPMQALTMAAKALRDLMALLNTPLGSLAFTGVLGLAGAVGARMALTGARTAWTASRGARYTPEGVLVDAAGQELHGGYRLKTAVQARALAQHLNDWTIGQLGWWGQVRDRFTGQPQSRLGRVGLGLGYGLAGAFSPPPGYSRSQMLGYGLGYGWGQLTAPAQPFVGPRPSGAYNAGRWAGKKLSGLAAITGGAVTAFIRSIPELAVIYAAFKGLDLAVEALGLSSATSAGKIDKLTQSLQAAQGAAEAAGRAAKLYQTVSATLGKRAPAEVERDLAALGKLSGGLGLTEAEQKNLRAASGRGDTRAMQDILQGASRRAAEVSLRNESLAAQRKGEIYRIAQAEADRLDNAPLASSAARDAARQEATRLSFEYTESLMNVGKAYQEVEAQSDTFIQSLRRIAGTTAAIKGLFTALPGDTAAARALKEQYGTQAQISHRQSLIDQLQREQAAAAEKEKVNEARRAALGNELADLDQFNANVRSPGDLGREAARRGLLGVVGFGSQSRRAKISEELAALESSPFALDTATRRKKIEELSDLNKKDQADLAQQAAAAQSAGWIDTLGRWSGDARSRAASFQTGTDPTASLLNAQVSLYREIEGINARIADSHLSQYERLKLVTQVAELEQQYADNGVTLARRQNDLQKEQNQLIADGQREQQKGLLAAGPAELLRKIYATRLANRARPLGLGEFMAQTPEVREELGRARPDLYSAEGMGIRRQMAALKAARDPRSGGGYLDEYTQAYLAERASGATGKAAGVLANTLPTLMQSAYTAGLTLESVSKYGQLAADALNLLQQAGFNLLGASPAAAAKDKSLAVATPATQGRRS